MKSALRIPYIILSLLLIACLFTYFFDPKGVIWLDNLSLDVAAEIIGILLVVFSVDRVIEIDRESERRQLESVAFRQLGRPIERHLVFLIQLSLHSLEQCPHSKSATIRDLFDADYFNRVSMLDLSKPAPMRMPIQVNWLDYLYHEFSHFQESLNRTVEKYSLYLNAETIDAIEDIINSSWMWAAIEIKILVHSTPDDRIIEMEDLFAKQGSLDLLIEYTQLFARLVEYYNQNVPHEDRIQVAEQLQAIGQF